MNSFFDEDIDARTQLVDFVHQCDKATADRRASECHENFMNLNSSPTMCLSEYSLKVQAGKLYAGSILKLF